jgi:drug/metabolite transporter (DMT)-like permease
MFVTLLSFLMAAWFEPQQWEWTHIYIYLPWLFFLAVSEGLGFILMAIGQNLAPPTHAAIILSLEGVFASIASYIFLGKYEIP